MVHGHDAYDRPAELVTGDAVVLDLRPAGFATRSVALLIDVLLLQVPALVGSLLLVSSVQRGLDDAVAMAVQVGLMVLIIVGYPAAAETLTRGRSLGKLVLGLRVVGTDGSPVRFRQALGRALAGAVEIWAGSGVIALISSLINRDGRRVGDFVAGTLVVSERASRRSSEEIPMPPRLAGWAASAELSGLSAETAAMARQYLLRFEELSEEARYEMGVRIAGLVAGSVSPPPPPDASPPEYLAAVLAERRRREAERLAARTGGTGVPSPPPPA
ncbi:RDD family protein [Nocardiopsis potens]|uniref:RDD family protein n=1 Tax=Nocardiopsis potens TaxID=1246458 RepID=UPI000348867D|nr:RDD family protein [Nocardiopsis potens]